MLLKYLLLEHGTDHIFIKFFNVVHALLKMNTLAVDAEKIAFVILTMVTTIAIGAHFAWAWREFSRSPIIAVEIVIEIIIFSM